MIQLPFRFDKEDLLVLSGAQMEQLRRTGCVELPPSSSKLPLGDYALVTRAENDEAESPLDFVSGEQPGTLAYYLHNTWLVRVEAQQPVRLALDVPKTLHTRFSGILLQPPAQGSSFNWEEFKRLIHSLDCKMAFSLQERVTRTGTFLGQVGVCTCGEDGCGSAYAWAEQDMLLAVFHSSGMALERVYLALLDETQ
ncbi:MAG: hypothetical protein JW726_17905 [Anaerolineales bacterium]|nr:hypothetical protein [Anaerolineales bacterium]